MELLQKSDGVKAPHCEFLAFCLAAGEHSFDIQKVTEMCGYDAITLIVNAPISIKGVFKLR